MTLASVSTIIVYQQYSVRYSELTIGLLVAKCGQRRHVDIELDTGTKVTGKLVVLGE